MPQVGELSVIPVSRIAPQTTDYVVCELRPDNRGGTPSVALVPISLIPFNAALTVGMTQVIGGGSQHLLYNNAGVLGDLPLGVGLAISSGMLVNTGELTINSSPISGGTTQRLLFDSAGVVGELILGTNLSISGNTLNATGAGLTVGSSTISGGTTNRILYDNAGVLGELIVGTNLSISSGTLNASTAGITIGTTTITSGTTNRLLFDNAGIVGELILGTNLSISGGNTLNATGSGITIGTTGITGGTTQRILYDNAGVVGELIVGTNLSIASGTLNATGGSGTTTVQTLDLDFPAYNNTLANVTGLSNSLSVSLTSGTSYYFKIFLQMVTPTGQSGGTLVPEANGGIQVALGGTAAVNYLSVSGEGIDDTTPFVVRTQTVGVATALTSIPTLITYVGTGQTPIAVLSGVLTCSTSGTMTVQFAQASNPLPAGGFNSAVLQGSFIELVPITIAANTGTSTNRFSPQYTGPNVTLSNGNLTVTRGPTGGSDSVVMGRNFHGGGGATGKFYAEFTFSTGSVSNSNQRFGFATAQKWLTRDLGADGDRSCSFTLGGTSFGVACNFFGTTFTGYAAFTNTTVFQMAIDVGAQKVWVNANNANWNGQAIGLQNPATGLGGLSFADGGTAPSSAIGGPISAAIELLDTGAVVTANFGATAYAFTPPTGFGNW